jgi:uncharacterized membrane protein
MTEHDPIGFAGLLLVMTLATYTTRVGGYWLIGRFAIRPRLRRMLDALPGVMIASIVAPILVRGGASGLLAVAAAVITMRLARNDFAAVIVGMAVAVLARNAGL